ncbi:hypothetical protein PSCICO_33700 [Pseudomonas cichorii]|uniref:hypothetical protein n=1 Tax=Pseudomonas cichorii TaxID=36746 RepID=UPI001910F278|nr:hypothetical protein [Pseudomonas cichorii]GFM87971.1 hypothetical protein PSCICO_33700 [Pseudomonas cichorii]
MKNFLQWIKNKLTGIFMSDSEWPRPKCSRGGMALIVKLVLIFLSMVALLATLYPLIDTGKMTLATASGISIVGVILFFLYGFLIFFEIYTLEGKRVFKQTDPDSIMNYMLHWIFYGGRVAIWTRDMSWAKDDKSKNLLREKARSGELIICLPAHTPLSQELEKEGADVYEYGAELLSDPSARFTIAYYGREGSKVAIGRARADEHVVEEFSSGSHPAFHLAYELVQIAKSVSQKKNGDK